MYVGGCKNKMRLKNNNIYNEIEKLISLFKKTKKRKNKEKNIGKYILGFFSHIWGNFVCVRKN